MNTREIQKRAQLLIDELDKRNINPFVSLAKAGLVLASVVFLLVIAFGFAKLDPAFMPNMVGAAQGLTVIALSIMAWHGYKGSQALYLIRHLHTKDSTALDNAPKTDGQPNE